MTRNRKHADADGNPPPADPGDRPTFSPLMQLHDQMTRLLADSLDRSSHHVLPPVEIRKDPACFRVIVRLPGIRREQILVELEYSRLLISVNEPPDAGSKDHLRMHDRGPRLKRSLNLPPDAQAERIEAHFDADALTILVPRVDSRQSSGPRRIPVRSALPLRVFVGNDEPVVQVPRTERNNTDNETEKAD